MSGYTPLFSSLTTGTLCGRWPDIGLWPIVLSLCDWRGVVDVTADYLSRVTGLAVEDVEACMRRFCEPDKRSRSNADEGRRLTLLEPASRDWGWKVVNLQLYRSRATGSDQVADGRNAAKVRRYKNKHRTPEDTAGHPASTLDTNSYSDSNTDSKRRGREDPSAHEAPTRTTLARVPRGAGPEWFLDFKLVYPDRAGDQGWQKAMRAANARMAEGHTPAEMIAGAERYAAYCKATEKTASEYVKQACTFLGPDKPFLLPWANPATKADTRLGNNLQAADEFMRRTEAG